MAGGKANTENDNIDWEDEWWDWIDEDRWDGIEPDCYA